MAEGTEANTTAVPGGKTAREVAETNRIKELGGKSSDPGSQTSNQRNPVSDKRMEKIRMDRQNKLLAHTQRNAELIGVFTEKQIPLDASRSIELHFWAWSQPNSVRLAYELYKKGFMLLLLKPALLQNDPSRWNIEAGARVSITTVASEEFTAGLVDLASSVEADYDGWGTSI